MKNLAKYFMLAAGASALLTTGCIDEPLPTSYATDDQVSASSKASEALVYAMPAFFNKLDAMGRGADDLRHYDWGYGSLMHIRDIMSQDMPVLESNYDLYYYWETDKYMGEDYVFANFVWSFYYKFIQTANNLIAAIDEEEANDLQKYYLGVAHTFRALAYLEAAQMYEFKVNDKVSGNPNAKGNDVVGLTVPIVTEGITEAESRRNPRVSHDSIVAFIRADLAKAEDYIALAPRATKVLPDLSAVYGLKARLALYDEKYDEAADNARKSINAGKYKPVTREEWLSTTSGFNDMSSTAWIWAVHQDKEDDVVQTGIVNWTAWMSPEASYGYASAGPKACIDARLYSEISDKDWRKLSWVAPEGSALEGKTPLIDPADEQPAYVGVKFRPHGGNTTDYNTASASDYPVMRIEEMYFIEAEATAQQGDVATAKTLLETFMTTYRYADYSTRAASQEDVINEILRQKRVEFWGEGLLFFDYKRLNLPVVRDYEGSNWYSDAALTTTTRPAWMNFCIPYVEKNNNTALQGFENDDPSDRYVPTADNEDEE